MLSSRSEAVRCAYLSATNCAPVGRTTRRRVHQRRADHGHTLRVQPRRARSRDQRHLERCRLVVRAADPAARFCVSPDLDPPASPAPPTRDRHARCHAARPRRRPTRRGAHSHPDLSDSVRITRVPNGAAHALHRCTSATTSAPTSRGCGRRTTNRTAPTALARPCRRSTKSAAVSIVRGAIALRCNSPRSGRRDPIVSAPEWSRRCAPPPLYFGPSGDNSSAPARSCRYGGQQELPAEPTELAEPARASDRDDRE